MKHTAGPWMIDEQYVIQKRSDKCICQWGNYTKEEDARLIAATPELLKACIAVMETFNEFRAKVKLDSEAPCIEIVRAAIAKATGETS